MVINVYKAEGMGSIRVTYYELHPRAHLSRDIVCCLSHQICHDASLPIQMLLRA